MAPRPPLKAPGKPRRVSSREDPSVEFHTDKVQTLNQERKERALLGTAVVTAVPAAAPMNQPRSAESLALSARVAVGAPIVPANRGALPGSGQAAEAPKAAPLRLGPDDRRRLSSVAADFDIDQPEKSATPIAIFIRELKQPVSTASVVQAFLDAAAREALTEQRFLVGRAEKLKSVLLALRKHAELLASVDAPRNVPDLPIPDDLGAGDVPRAQRELQVDAASAATLRERFERACADVESYHRSAHTKAQEALDGQSAFKAGASRLRQQLEAAVNRALRKIPG